MRGASYLKPPVQSVGYSDQCILNSDSFSYFRSSAKHPMSLVLVERFKEDGPARVALTFMAGMGRRTNANPR